MAGKMLAVGFLLVFVFQLAAAQEVKRARLEVKRFISAHLPDYPDVDIKYIGGADPEMVFLDKDYNEVERVGVMKMSEDDLIELLSSHGIEKRTEEEAEADEEFEPWDENQQQEQQQQDHQEL